MRTLAESFGTRPETIFIESDPSKEIVRVAAEQEADPDSWHTWLIQGETILLWEALRNMLSGTLPARRSLSNPQ